jgi:molecular chaperone DnaJ
MNKQPKKDYYAILEIDKNASETDIKKSYKKLAVKWHPDKNPNNLKEAEEKFKEIVEAYSILSNPQKKSQYDQFGMCDGEAPDFSQGFPDLSEIFGGMGGFPGFGGMGGFPGFGGMGRREPQVPVQEVKVKLKLAEIYKGCEKSIDINFNCKCEDCAGTGSTTKVKKICPTCDGKGINIAVIQIGPGMIQQQRIPCNGCNQKGWISDKANECMKCKASGLIENKLSKTLNIKKNFDYQTKMCLRNSGNYDVNLEKSSDIYITFIISDLDKYKLLIKNDYDLYYEKNINIYDALSGYSLYYSDHPDNNKYVFKFNNIIKDDDIVYARSIGLPNDGGKRGKFFIKLNYIYPDQVLESEQLKAFLKNKEVKNITDKTEYIKEKVYTLDNKEDNHQPDQDGGPGECKVN